MAQLARHDDAGRQRNAAREKSLTRSSGANRGLLGPPPKAARAGCLNINYWLARPLSGSSPSTKRNARRRVGVETKISALRMQKGWPKPERYHCEAIGTPDVFKPCEVRRAQWVRIRKRRYVTSGCAGRPLEKAKNRLNQTGMLRRLRRAWQVQRVVLGKVISDYFLACRSRTPFFKLCK